MNIENLNKYKNALLILNEYILLSHNEADGILSESRFNEINMPLSHEQYRKIEEVTSGKPLRATLINLILYTCPYLSDEVRQLLYNSKKSNVYYSEDFRSALFGYKSIKISDRAKYILQPLATDHCGNLVYLVIPIDGNSPIRCYATYNGVHPNAYCALDDEEYEEVQDLIAFEIQDWHEIPLRVLDFLKAGNTSVYFNDVCSWESSSHSKIIWHEES